MKYQFKYKRLKSWLWKKETVVGHNYEASQDKMVFFLSDGSIKEVARWKDCEVELGQDWVMAMKKKMEKEAGVNIPVNVED